MKKYLRLFCVFCGLIGVAVMGGGCPGLFEDLDQVTLDRPDIDVGSADSGTPDVDEEDTNIGEPDADGGTPDIEEPNHPVQLSVGFFNACLLMSEGEVFCWGSNWSGQLGYSGILDDNSRVPVEISSFFGAEEVAVDNSVVCARFGDGSVECIGSTEQGLLGELQEKSTHIPVGIDIEGVKKLYMASSRICVTTNDFHLHCWGTSSCGELDPSRVEDVVFEPFHLQELGRVLNFAGGEYFSCAYTATQELKCWGHNELGQLARSDYDSTSIEASGYFWGATVLDLVAGWDSACALLNNNSTLCWGNFNPDLGITWCNSEEDFGEVENNYMPTDMGLVDIKSLAAGADHYCALSDSGEVYCWGGNGFGQLGDGTTQYRPEPVQVQDLPSIRVLAAGGSQTCAIDEEHDVWCWGANQQGELGVNRQDNFLREPTKVISTW